MSHCRQTHKTPQSVLFLWRDSPVNLLWSLPEKWTAMYLLLYYHVWIMCNLNKVMNKIWLFSVNWLDHSKTLREQGVDVNETLLLRRKFFFSDQNVDARDPVQLNLLYVQVSVNSSCLRLCLAAQCNTCCIPHSSVPFITVWMCVVLY